MSRTRIDVEVDTVHLTEVMRRFGVSHAGEAVRLALRSAASPPMTGADALALRDGELVEEVVSVESLQRSTAT